MWSFFIIRLSSTLTHYTRTGHNFFMSCCHCHFVYMARAFLILSWVFLSLFTMNNNFRITFFKLVYAFDFSHVFTLPFVKQILSPLPLFTFSLASLPPYLSLPLAEPPSLFPFPPHPLVPIVKCDYTRRKKKSFIIEAIKR